MVIGLLYGLQCMLLTSYCLYYVIKYFTLLTGLGGANPDSDIDLKDSLAFNIVFGLVSITYIATSRQTNFQNY